MTTQPVVIGVHSLAGAATAQTLKPDALATTATHQTLHPAAARPDDFNASVAGEEDPGASLDLIAPAPTDAPAAWCPWPRERAS